MRYEVKTIMHPFEPGDRVMTTKGKRNRPNQGVLEVVEIGLHKHQQQAVICRNAKGLLNMYLAKNLRFAEED